MSAMNDSRPISQIRQHYEVEKALASRLMAAGSEERKRLYSVVYDEMYRAVPHHPMLVQKASAADRQRYAQRNFNLIRRYLRPDSTFLEIGAGDCALSALVAGHVAGVFAVDVSEVISSGSLPENCRLVLSDGTSVIEHSEVIDLAFSNQLMEHLHPDDASSQLRNIYDALKPGGRYLCITPNELTGPHDVSRHFDRVARGFHLKEYTYHELVVTMRAAGFTDIRALVGGRGVFAEVPASFVLVVEALAERLGDPWPKRRPFANLLNTLRIVARKPLDSRDKAP